LPDELKIFGEVQRVEIPVRRREDGDSAAGACGALSDDRAMPNGQGRRGVDLRRRFAQLVGDIVDPRNVLPAGLVRGEAGVE
jgi:hypothetical protein